MRAIYAIKGFIASLVLLVLAIVAYYTTVTVGLTTTSYSFIFRILVILYAWPFMLVAFVTGLDIYNPLVLIVISSGTYSLICYLWGKYDVKKRGKGHRNRRRSI